MKKKRHKWGDVEKNIFTKQQKCNKCGLIRFNALGDWKYSKEKVTIDNPFPDEIKNEGCI